MQCCFFATLDFTSTTSHIHNWALFLLWLHPFILSEIISPLISSNILGTYRPGEFLFQYPIILPFHTVHGVLKARILKWFAIPFCQTSPPWPTRLWRPHTAWLSFIELEKAVVLVWLDWLVFCDYGFSVSALWCPLATQWTMDRGSWHCTGDRDQDHLYGKEMQKSKMAVWGGLTNSCEKKKSVKQRRKGKI